MTALPQIVPDARSLAGRLEIDATALPDGRTVLARQFHSVPFHLSKPYWDGRVLIVQAVNPTAGIFQGDRMTCRVRATPGAAVLLTAPSAARAHARRDDRDDDDAVLLQHFRVEAGAWLEVFPELLIPQSGSSFRQHTEIDIAEGGQLYFVEMLAPGRVARGECLAWRRLEWSFTLRVGEKLVAVERASVEPPARSWMLEVPGWKQAYYAGAWAVSPALRNLPDDLFEAIEGLADDTNLLGVSRVADGVLAVKMLAETGTGLRRLHAAVRELMTPHLPLLRSRTRKI